MILYKKGGIYHLLNTFRWSGSVFPRSLVVAIPSAIFAAILKIGIQETEWLSMWNKDDSIVSNNAAFAGFSFFIGFLIVFRTSEAHKRFWEGTTATHAMRCSWYNAASALFAFCHHSKAPAEEKNRFRHILVRLFSMLHSTALSELDVTSKEKDIDEQRGYLFDVLDPLGLDEDTLEAVHYANFKVELIFAWIQALIVSEVSTGVLSIPPPILTRSFQEIGSGMVAFHDAQKIVEVPFPFPYAQTCDALLLMHLLIVPFVTAPWVATWYWAAIFVFIQVFVLWSLLFIAVEVEDPFGADANDLDAQAAQEEFNCQLIALLDTPASTIPSLSARAQLGNISLNSLSSAWKHSGLRRGKRNPKCDPRTSTTSSRQRVSNPPKESKPSSGTLEPDQGLKRSAGLDTVSSSGKTSGNSHSHNAAENNYAGNIEKTAPTDQSELSMAAKLLLQDGPHASRAGLSKASDEVAPLVGPISEDQNAADSREFFAKPVAGSRQEAGAIGTAAVDTRIIRGI